MRITLPAIPVLALAVLALVISCSDDDNNGPSGSNNEPSTTSVGPQGGVVVVDGGMTLVVPAGALSDTVTFTATANGSPPAAPGGMGPVSTCYSVGPSGMQFGQPATMSIAYDTARLLGAGESDLGLYSFTGGGWRRLATSVYPGYNLVTAEVAHLCDFAVFADTAAEAEGIYAALVAHRDARGCVFDKLVARLDAAYAPGGPQLPLQVDSVTCNQFELEWVEKDSAYVYGYLIYIWEIRFLKHDSTYEFQINGSGVVPDLTASIVFPSCSPWLTSPDYGATESLSGFGVTWDDCCAGNVSLFFLQGNDTVGTVVETPNDGSYAFTGDQLDGFEAGEYRLVMTSETRQSITAEGYDPRSYVAARIVSKVAVTLE